MKITSIYLIIAGIVVMIVGCFIFQGLNYVNAVDSHRTTININGIRSFPWPVFVGFVIFMLGIVFNISARRQPGHRIR